MNLFDVLIVQPIFNVLMLIYAITPGLDFGITIIIFTILVRFAMWPLVKKQLHQTKLMREVQPELKKIKERSKGNKQLEAQLMMELYREKGVSPFGSIGLLIVQLPIFFALYRVISIMTQHRDQIGNYAYNFLEKIPAIGHLADNPNKFNESLLGIVDLTKHAITNGNIYWPALILGLLAAVFQFIQSRQLTPKPAEKRRLRDILKEQASGKAIDQSEVNTAISNKMVVFLPLMTLFISLYLPAALVLYYAAQSAVAVLQQKIILGRDASEMDKMADKKTSASQRAKNAIDAEIVNQPKSKKSAKRRKQRRKK